MHLLRFCAIAIVNARRYQEMVRAEEGLRKAERLSTLGILGAEIAHEIRNPVAIISMLVHSLMGGWGGRSRPTKRSSDNRRQAGADQSHCDAGAQSFPAAAASFGGGQSQPSHRRFVVLLSHTLSARSILVKKRLARTLPMVRGERGHFDQVLLNLMLNAIDAMPRGDHHCGNSSGHACGAAPCRGKRA